MVDGTDTEYYYNGSVLMYMITGSGSTAVKQRFSYDAAGNVAAVVYKNGSSTAYTYYYIRNAQGDVVKLIDEDGITVVEYTYNSWVKPISVTGTLATTLGANQPFRYRGYVYDTDTGMYYLQSRYYNPNICRFISADVLLSTGQGVIGHNSFAYCLNTPCNGLDSNGHALRPCSVVMDDCGTGKNKDWYSENYEYNRQLQYWTKTVYPKGHHYDYIISQTDSNIANKTFGSDGTIGENGCGLVAYYNVLVGAGYDVDFDKLNNQVGSSFALVNGLLGTNPFALTNQLKKQFGSNNVSIISPESTELYDAIIVMYVWTRNNRIGVHYYAAINNGSGIYTPYNDGNRNSSNYQSMITGTNGRIISIWGINY